MSFITVENGNFVEHVPGGNIEWDERHFQTVESLTQEEKDLFGVVELLPTPIPEYDPSTHKIVEANPEFFDNAWRQVWNIVEMTEEEAEEYYQANRRLIDKALVLERITDEQLETAMSLMTTRQKERWRMPSKPEIYVDDPELIALLTAIGADLETVLA